MKYIFLHGLGQAPSSWNHTLELLDNQSDILCPDLSNWLSGKEVCYSNLYQALEDYCGQFDEPINVCGLSLGGILALQYGINHPDKINSLVLIGAQSVMPKRLLQLQNIMFRFCPDSMFQKMGFRKMDVINLTKSMMDLNFQQDLKKIGCNVLVICGENDKANKTAALQLKEQIPHGEMVIIANAGHEVNADNPAALGTTLHAFYRKMKVEEGV